MNAEETSQLLPNGGTSLRTDEEPYSFSSQVIIDADEGQHGWEIVIRLDQESMEAAWTDVDDDGLRKLAPDIGFALVETIIAERDTVRFARGGPE